MHITLIYAQFINLCKYTHNIKSQSIKSKDKVTDGKAVYGYRIKPRMEYLSGYLKGRSTEAALLVVVT